MTPKQFLAKLDPDRKKLLTTLHEKILRHDEKVVAKVQTMMRQEMIGYCQEGVFKYGLSPVKGYMSLHLMPMYAIPALHAKFKAMLPKAKFQKGCINFKNEEQMPIGMADQLLRDCASEDYTVMIEQYKMRRVQGRAERKSTS